MANPYFNAAYYLANNPDLVLAGLTVDNVEQHYLQYGAEESLLPNSTRAPNPWFNASFYLRSNPDLIAAGLTAADALAHYSQYGVYEGRVFSPTPALNPANFDAKAYANANKDLVTALQIADVNNLTAQEKGALLGHFQAYGVNEGRATGAAANSPAEAFVNATRPAVINVVDGTVALGTIADDVFQMPASTLATGDYAVNGLEGTDLLKVADFVTGAKIAVQSVEKLQITTTAATAAGATLNVTGTGVQSVEFNNAAAMIYAGSKVAGVTLKTVNAVEAQFTGVSGTSDALDVAAGKAATGFTVNGVETINLGLAADAANFILTANSVNGSDLKVVVSGGKADAAHTLTVASVGSGDLTTVTVDASASLNNQTIVLDGSLALPAAVLIGGAGADTITAHAGVDTLTGNGGADIFSFTAANAKIKLAADGKIAGFDTVLDFSKGADAASSDIVQFDALTAQAAGALGTVGNVSATGVLTFDTGYAGGKTFDELINGLSDAMTTADRAVVFKHGGDSYVFVSGGTGSDLTDDALIKLAGVTDNLAVDVADNNAITFVVS